MQYPQKDLYKQDEEDMDWTEFTTLLSGIMPDTPLGKIISIRSEENEEVLKNFSNAQHCIRNDWRDKQTQELIESMNKDEVMMQIKKLFTEMCV